MIDKPFYTIVALWGLSFGLLGAQYLADSYGITLTGADGTPIKTAVQEYIDIDRINSFATNVTSSNNGTSWGLEPIIQAGNIATFLFYLLTGIFVFNILYLLGLPAVFIVPIVIVYYLQLGRAIIALIRGV